jgi:hypothetical protein
VADFQSRKRVSASLTAQNTFSDGVEIYGDAVFELTGTWSATVHVQRQSDGTNWRDVTDNAGAVVTFSGNGQYTFSEPARDVSYRFGVKTGNYTSGTVAGVIQQ